MSGVHGGTSAADTIAYGWVRTFVLRMTSVGVPLGALISVYYAVWTPLRPDRNSRTVAAASNLIGLVLFAAVFVVLFRRRHRPRLARALRWLDEGRDPTAAETAVVFRLPSQLALEQFGAMVVVGAVLAIGNVLNAGLEYEWLRTLVGLCLFGATLAALAYLIAEATLRPVFARFGTAVPRSAVGVAVRLLVAWAVGSAVPLLFLAAIPLRGTSGRQLPTTAPLEFMALLAIVIGAITTVLVARSIAQPLSVVRVGLRQVQGGDLSAAVPVDDPGEVGELQAAFNNMVEGLRERSALQDMFGRHVGEEVARQALATGVRLGGETREATVMFVDLVGSTALAEQRPPDEVVDLLNRFFGEVVRAVEAEGGWVDKFEGDGALAVFGVPTPFDDHAPRALRAARALASILATDGIQVGMGIATGELVAGNVGTQRRFEYTVIGWPVNQAARLADLAKTQPSSVLAAADVAERAGTEARHWRPGGTVVLRGIDHEVTVVSPTSSLPGATPPASEL